MKRYTTFLFALCLYAALQAQDKNLNPTVKVTNSYQASLVEAEKPSAIIFIPDSLYKFNLNFDYSGFENPYRGTSDFNPFLTELDIAKRPVRYKKLYLKAGAGYAFSPELDLSWEVKSEGGFKMGVFASHDSYFGNYSGLLEKGADSHTLAGMDFRFDWSKANAVLSTWYEGTMGKNDAADAIHHYNSACASLAVNSNLDPSLSKVRYRALANYFYGSDRFGDLRVAEHVIDADGFVDMLFGKHLIELDGDLDAAFSGGYSGICAIARPRYIFTSGALSLSAGFALGLYRVSGTAVRDRKVDIFPSIDLNVKAVAQKLVFYAAADLESKLFSCREAALQTRFYVPDDHRAITKTAYAHLGLKGDFSGKFSYNASFGYRHEVNPALYSVGENGVSFVHVSSLNHYFAALKLKTIIGPFSLGGDVEYRQYANADELDIVPPAFEAGAFLRYHIRERWHFEVSANYRSFYKSNGFYADDFVNLEAQARYNFTSRFGIYLKGANILGQKLQAVPGYARNGVSVLGGIVLNF